MEFTGLINFLEQETKNNFDDLSAITENIVNAGTPGYKTKRKTSFGEVLRNMEVGKLSATNNNNDVSLEGKGFFILIDKDNKPLLTRNLSLSVDKDLYLKNDNHYIFPKVKLTKQYSKLKISLNGEIYGLKGDGTRTLLGKLKVVNFPAAEKLSFDGFYYYPTEEAGTPKEVSLGNLSDSKVRQKFLETSNVNSPLEFVNFSRTNFQLKNLASIIQQLSTTRKSYIQTLKEMTQ